jgi:hypothetical protein
MYCNRKDGVIKMIRGLSIALLTAVFYHSLCWPAVITIPEYHSAIQQGFDTRSDGDTVLAPDGIISVSERINSERTHSLLPYENSPFPLNIVSEIEPNNTCDSAQALACGDTVWCATMTDGQDDNDWYVFTITSAQLVTIATHLPSGVCDPPMINTFLHLWTGDCQTWLASDDNSGTGLFSLISMPLAPGTYAINSENRWNNTGSYHLSIDCDNVVYMNGFPAGIAWASQCDVVYPFQAGVADDFTLSGTDSIDIGMAVVWFNHWDNYNGPADYTGLNLYVYEDNGGTPGGEPVDLDLDCLHEETIPDGIAYYVELLPGEFSFWIDFMVWKLAIPINVKLAAGVTYWLEVQPVMSYIDAGQSGWINTNIVTGYYAQQIFELLGLYPYATMADSVDMAFYLVEGDSATTGISDNIPSSPYRFMLLQNYPNPFNASTTIEYGLPEAGRVRIDVYDLLGRKIETLFDEERQAGQHQVVWDALDHSSGIYFYRIEAGDYTETRKMILLK